MRRIIDKTAHFIFNEQGGMFSSAMLISVMIIVSRLFGFLRYRILDGFYTTGELDVFYASFRIPDLVFEILITGAFTSTFIPIFIRYQKNRPELEENISTIFNIIGLILFFFITISVVSLPWLMPLITPGFSGEKMTQIIYFSQILLVSQLPFLVVGNFVTGIAQAKKTFFLSALAPVVYNIMIIVFTYVFFSQTHLFAPIIGVVLGAFSFLLIQSPILFHLDFTYRLLIKMTTGVKEFFRLVLPRIFTVVVAQIDATIDLTLSSLLGSGAYTVFYLAQRLQLLPVSVIGMAFGQASLPYLSELFEEKKIEELKKIIVNSVLNVFFLTLPITGYFILARTPIVRLFFGGEKFDWEATVLTALAFSYFSISIPFHSIYYFITRCFYALLDSRTPFFVSLFAIVVNTVISLLFVLYLHLPVWSLAISFSISVYVNVSILVALLHRRLGGLDLSFLFRETIKMAFVSAFSSLPTYALMKLLDGLVFDTTRTINVFFLLVTGASVYFLLYLFFSWIINVKEIYVISRLIFKVKAYQKKLVEIYTVYE